MATTIDIYDRGYVDGVRAFAHWKDGEQFVGTAGTKMTDAILKRKDSSGYDPPACCFNVPLLTASELLEKLVDLHKQLEQYAENSCNPYARYMASQAAATIARANGESPVLSMPSTVIQ